jgi:hypothetical protein
MGAGVPKAGQEPFFPPALMETACRRDTTLNYQSHSGCGHTAGDCFGGAGKLEHFYEGVVKGGAQVLLRLRFFTIAFSA